MSPFARFEVKVMASFAAAILVVTGLLIATWQVAKEATESVQWVAHSHELLESLARTGAETLQVEFSTQNFRLSGDPARLAERDAAIAAREVLLSNIKALASDNPRQQARWMELRHVINERMTISREVEKIRKSQGQEAASAFAAAAPLKETRGRTTQLLSAMEDEERQLLAVRLADSQRAQQVMVYSGALAGAALLALLSATFIFIRRQLNQTETSRNTAMASEQSLATMLESIGDGVIATDLDARVTRMNPVAEQLTGWSLSQALGLPIEEVFDIVHEQTRDPAIVPVSEVLMSGEIRQLANHTVLIAKNGQERPIADSAAPIRDGEGTLHGVVLVFRDVSAEHQAQQAIREHSESLELHVLERTNQLIESNERYKTLFRTSPDALALTSLPDGRYLDVNDGFSRLFGWQREEVIGKTSTDLGIWCNTEHRLALIQAMENTGRCASMEAEFMAKNGKPITTLVSAQAIGIDDERCMLSVTHDITERKNLQQTLDDSRQFIVRVVDSLTEHIAVIDSIGKIISVNEAWKRFAKDNGDTELTRTCVGVNYLDVCEQSTNSQLDDGAATAAFGIRSVLNGDRQEFVIEYPCHSPWEQRWFELHVVPLLGANGGAVLFHQNITDHKRADEALRASEDSYHRQFVDNSVVMLLIDIATGAIVDANVAAQAFYGYSLAQLQEMNLSQINTLQPDELRKNLDSVASSGRGNFETEHRISSGELRAVEVSASLMLFRGRQILHSIIHDITDRRRAESLIRESEQHFRTLANGGSLLIWTSGLDKLCNYFNEPWLRFTGRTMAQEVGNGWAEGVHPEDFDQCLQVYMKAFEQRQPFSMDYRLRHADGAYRWIRDDGNPRYDSQGEFLGYIGFCMDITERKASAEQIEHLAFYDSLTQLPNRRLMLDRLGQALSNSARRNRHGAVLMIDLDNFKSLNDNLGHHVGDELLIEVAARLQSCIRVGDTASRLGGDEFVAILEDLDESEQAAISAEYVGDKILASLSAPYFLEVTQQSGTTARVTHHCTSSIGIAIFREESVSAEELIKRADTAMFQAKAAGRNTKRFFDPEMQAAVTVRAKLESDLRRAIQNKEFLLYYQMQVDSLGRTIGAEALIRWQHPQDGLVPPDLFIPVAEETGLITPIGNWVMETACKQLTCWAKDPRTADLTLAVNVSANQFRLPNFVEQVLATINTSGAKPDRIKLELTESLLLDNAEDIIFKMNTLKMIGVRFSLDDFGTGYSSLAYLKRLPLDQLKIDKSFVCDVLTDPNDAVIARAIIALSHSLGLAVIAEGVETHEQRQFLASAGCLVYQGYLFSRPLPIAQFEALIA